MAGLKNGSQQQTKGPRRSKRGSLSNNQEKSLLAHNKGDQPSKIRGDINKLLHQNAKIDGVLSPRRRKKTATGNEREATLKTGKEAREKALTKSKPEKKGNVKDEYNQRYNCSHCKKVFDSEPACRSHERLHKWCESCKKFLPSPSILKTHKPLCEAKKLRKSSKQKCQKKLKGTAPVQNKMLPSTKTDGPSMKYSCLHCDAKFKKPSKLKKHMLVHAPVKPFTCSICPKKFKAEPHLKIHMTRMHKYLGDTDGDHSWTAPLEDSTAPNNTSAPKNMLNDRQNIQHSRELTAKWKECGTLGPGGFSCNVCLVVKKTKLHLVEHYCIHTGEKPYRCAKCNSRFRFQGRLITHSKQCNHVPKV